MSWRVQLRAKPGTGNEVFKRIFNGLPNLGHGVALVDKDTEVVLTFIAESEPQLASVKNAQTSFEKQGFKVDITDLGK